MKTKEETLNPKMGAFEKFSLTVTNATGSTPAFIVAFTFVLVWAVTGPLFDYSEQWQLVINTGTTIITFLMVFLIQKSQNKDSLAIQLKLNELVAAHEFASNRLVNVETMTEDELKVIKKYYASLSELTKNEETLQQSHSIDEAASQHELKKELESGATGRKAGARSQESGARSQEPGARSQKPGTGNQKPGAKGQKPGAGNQKSGAASQKPGAGK